MNKNKFFLLKLYRTACFCEGAIQAEKGRKTKILQILLCLG